MKSTIKVDFSGMNREELSDIKSGFEPVIRVNLQDSDDVRDGLLATFFQSLGGDSSWLSVYFHEELPSDNGIKRISIYPIREDELQETIEIIKRRLDSKK